MLEGHEVLQNGFLKATGQVARRGTGAISRGNPSLAVGEDLHLRIGAEQRLLGLNDPQQLASMSDEEVIRRNVLALERAGVERSQITIIEREATQYAARVRASTPSSPSPAPPPQTPTLPPVQTSVAPAPPEGASPPSTAGPRGQPAPPEMPGAPEPGLAAEPAPLATGTTEAGAAEVVAGDIAAADVAAGATLGEVLGDLVVSLGVSLVEGLVIGLAIEFGINIAKHMLSGKGSRDPEQERIEALLMEKVGGPAAKAVKAQSAYARKLTVDDPERSVYANIMVDLVYTAEEEVRGGPYVGMSIERKQERLTDARFVGVELDYRPVNMSELTTGIEEDRGHYHRETRRRVYATEINPLGEKSEVHHWRALRREAQRAVARGISVRTIAEGTHWVNEKPGHEPGYASRDWTWADDRREHQPRAPREPSWREQVERSEQELWVEAYIDYTGDHPEFRAQYEEAMKYLKELHAEDAKRARELEHPFGFDRLSPSDRRTLEEFIRRSQ